VVIASDSAPLLGFSYRLSDGSRVRLRLAAISDGPKISALLAARGHEDAELQAARLTRYDPRFEVVVCATSLVAGHEVLMAVGAVALSSGVPEAPDFLAVAPAAPSEVAALVAAALLGRARTLARRRAA
jgi:hypothetical protein